MDGEAGRGGRNPVPAKKKLWTEQSLQAGMDFAAEGSKTEILSIFMDIRKDQFPKKKKTFEL